MDTTSGLGPVRLGHYRLESLIGRGAVGEVHRARDTVKDRVVALKLLVPALAADPDFRSRFQRECEVISTLTNPHIVPVHDFGVLDDRLFLDMRLIDGPHLGVLVAREGRLAPPRAVDVVEQLASALAAAHTHGIVHGDVKPSNALTVPTGAGDGDVVYLSDFGVARSVGTDFSTRVIGGGSAVGTFEYMAPERFRADEFDRRADVYALGCVLFECLTGRRPYPQSTLPALMNAHLSARVPRPGDVVGGLPRALDEVVATAMAKSPGDRYSTAGALAASARDALTAAGGPAPRTSAWAPSGGGVRIPEQRGPVGPVGPGPAGGPARSGVPAAPPGHRGAPGTPSPSRFPVPPGPPWSMSGPPGPMPGTPGSYGWAGGPHGGHLPPPRRPVWLWVLGAVFASAALIAVLITSLVFLAGASGSTTAAPPGPGVPTAPPGPGDPPSTDGWTVVTLFGVPGNGACVRAQPRLGESDALQCRRPATPVTATFVQYTGTAQDYLASMRDTDAVITPIGASGDCSRDYQVLFTSRGDGRDYQQYVRIWDQKPFAGIWESEINQATWQQVVDEPSSVADPTVFCN